MADILYGLAVLLAALLGVLIQAAAVLPSPILGGLVALLIAGVVYRRGWNDAQALVRDEGIRKSVEDYQRRRR